MESDDLPVLDAIHVYCRIIQMTNEIVRLDKQWHARYAWLVRKHTTPFHIDNDIMLKNYSGASRVLSDLVVGLTAGLQTYQYVTGDPIVKRNRTPAGSTPNVGRPRGSSRDRPSS